MKRRYFQNLLDLAIMASDSVSQGCPAKIQPFIKVVVYLCTLAFLLIFIPLSLPFSFVFHLLYRFKKQPAITPFMKLEKDVQSTWYSESSYAALTKLRDVRQQLIEHEIDGLSKGIHISPYGLFKLWDYFQVLWLLYHYEMSHRCWDEAKKICEEVLEFSGGGETRWSKFMRQFPHIEEWIVNNAKVLSKLEGELVAQQYLLQYLDPEHQDNPINTYFYELRKRSGKPPIEGKDHDRQDAQYKTMTEKGKESLRDNANHPKQTITEKTKIVELPRQNAQESKEFSE